MKAVVIHQFGGVEQIHVEELPLPPLDSGEILIKVGYAGVNPVDCKIRKGLLKSRIDAHFPLILGWDAAGEVVQIGSDVKTFKVGDLVYTYCRKPKIQWGAYAEFLSVDHQAVAIKPAHLSMAQAASVPLAGLTAWQSLFDKAALKSGETLLVHAGAGGVGGFAIQWAKWKGALVITTAKSNNHEYVLSLGADEVIDYSKDNFVEVIKKKHPQGVDVVFDTVGGSVFSNSYQVLKKGGRIVSILEPVNEELNKRYGVQGEYHFVFPSGSDLKKIALLFDQGRAKPLPVQEFLMSDASKAQLLLEGGQVRGKIVLKIVP